MMSKREIMALIIVLSISIGVPLGIYYYEFEYRPSALRILTSGHVHEFTVDASYWNLSEIRVNKGDMVKLLIHSKDIMGFYIENYVEKQHIVGSLSVQFVANEPGTFSIMLSKLEFQCHCWISSKYDEVGKLMVLEKALSD